MASLPYYPLKEFILETIERNNAMDVKRMVVQFGGLPRGCGKTKTIIECAEMCVGNGKTCFVLVPTEAQKQLYYNILYKITILAFSDLNRMTDLTEIDWLFCDDTSPPNRLINSPSIKRGIVALWS